MARPILVTHKLVATYVVAGLVHSFGFYCSCVNELDDPIIDDIKSIEPLPMSDLGITLVAALAPALHSSTSFDTFSLFRWDTDGPQTSWELITQQALSGTGTTGTGHTLSQQTTFTYRDTSGGTMRYALFETCVPGLMERFTLATMPGPYDKFVLSMLGIDLGATYQLGSYARSRSNLGVQDFNRALATQSANIYKHRVGIS